MIVYAPRVLATLPSAQPMVAAAADAATPIDTTVTTLFPTELGWVARPTTFEIDLE